GRRLWSSLTQSRVARGIQISTQTALLILYAYAAFSKLINLPQFRYALLQSPLFDATLASVLAYVVPIWEALLCAMLIGQRTILLGYVASLFTMLAFTTYLVFIYFQFPVLPCGCGGVIGKLSYSGHIALNLFFAALSAVGVWTLDSEIGESAAANGK
ncbi:MAG: hypothetical protein NZM05_12095, partial [Chloroherpetonaceae bacterium]|nr:hypothetical protein [Chloroherpetonaceae bacterium]